MTPEEIDTETNNWKAAHAERKAQKAITTTVNKENKIIHKEILTEDSGGNPLIINEHNEHGL